MGGLLAMAAGFVLGAVGYLSRRRFTTWFGGFLASVGAIVIAGDVSPLEDAADSDSPDLISSGLIVALFGVIVVAIAFLVARLQRAAGGSTDATTPSQPTPPDAPAPGTRPPARVPTRRSGRLGPRRRRPGRHRPLLPLPNRRHPTASAPPPA